MLTMAQKYLRIIHIEDITPPGLDGHRYRIYFEIYEKENEEEHRLTSEELDVTVSRTLQTIWGLSDKKIFLPSVSIGFNKLLEIASMGSLDFPAEIDLNTSTAPKRIHSIPIVTPNTEFPIPEVNVHEIDRKEESKLSFLSEDISEIRDQINAISKHLTGERLLILPQERMLFDIYKMPNNWDEFSNRVSSLGGLVVAINKKAIIGILGSETNLGDRSINNLQIMVKEIFDEDPATEICDVLRNILYLRHGYPQHGDNLPKVIPAYDFFGLPYPIRDYSMAWDTIIKRYFDIMNQLLDIMSEYRTKAMK